MPVDLIVELSKVENIVGIKEASGNLEKASRIIEETIDEDFLVLSGDDGLTLPIVSIGGYGVISVVANIVPDKMVKLVNYALTGDMVAAREVHYEIAPLIRAMFTETNPIPVKRAMGLIGLASGHLRLPLAPLSSKNEQVLLEALRTTGVLHD